MSSLFFIAQNIQSQFQNQFKSLKLQQLMITGKKIGDLNLKLQTQIGNREKDVGISLGHLYLPLKKEIQPTETQIQEVMIRQNQQKITNLSQKPQKEPKSVEQIKKYEQIDKKEQMKSNIEPKNNQKNGIANIENKRTHMNVSKQEQQQIKKEEKTTKNVKKIQQKKQRNVKRQIQILESAKHEERNKQQKRKCKELKSNQSQRESKLKNIEQKTKPQNIQTCSNSQLIQQQQAIDEEEQMIREAMPEPIKKNNHIKKQESEYIDDRIGVQQTQMFTSFPIQYESSSEQDSENIEQRQANQTDFSFEPIHLITEQNDKSDDFENSLHLNMDVFSLSAQKLLALDFIEI